MKRDQPYLQDARVTLAFLTRIPVRHGDRITMGRIARWFPTVGGFIGVLAALSLVLAESVFGMQVAACFAILVGALITGGFHHDGLADSADGLVGGWTPEQRREILKDSRHGTYGVLALIFQILIQITLLSQLPIRFAVIAVLVMHIGGRASAVSVMKSGPGVTEGLGANYVAGVSKIDIALSLISAFVLSFIAGGWYGIVGFLPSLIISQLLVRYAIRKIGGIVGDVLGAIEQISETVFLMVAVGFVNVLGSYGW